MSTNESTANKRSAAHSQRRGMDRLLTVQNAKTRKGEKLGFLTGILYLAPANESGVMNTCASSTPECRHACLYTAGRGRFADIKSKTMKRRRGINRFYYLRPILNFGFHQRRLQWQCRVASPRPGSTMAGMGKASRKKQRRDRIVIMSEEARQGLAGQS